MKPESKALNKYWNILFFVLLGAMALLYGYHDILFMRPWSMHQWRQCDCLSITYNYYKEGMHFFSPAVHWCGPTGDGKTCTSEYPWLYYLIACLWQIFGYHEFIYRMVDTMIAFTGLYFLYKLCKELLQDGFWSIMVPLFLFTSPIFVFYGNNFITDVPSLSITLVAWYYFFKFYKDGSNGYFFKWMFFCLLAGLTKITALLSFVPVFIIFPIEAIGMYRFRSTGKIFNKTGTVFFSFIAVIGILLGWTLYAIKYNDLHNGGVFSTQTFPLWKADSNTVQQVLRSLFNTLLPEFMGITVLMGVLLFFLIILIIAKQVNKLLLYLCSTVFVGCILYLLLWFQVFTVHDYYLTNLLIFIPLVFITFLDHLKTNHIALFKSSVTKASVGIVFVFNVYYCTVQTRLKYYPGSSFVKYTFILDSPALDYWTWYHWNYSNYQKPWETITPYLRSLGIKREDKVVSIPDQSINISLYLMDQKGYTNYSIGNTDPLASMQYFVSNGAKYLIINNPDYVDSSWVKPYTYKKVGQYKHILIFDMTYKMTRRDTEAVIIKAIKSNPEWFNNVKKGAEDKGIPIDSALMLNAQFMLKTNQFKL